MLVDVIQRKLMGHCLQDLVCSKCKEVNHRNQCQEEWSICFVILGDSIQHGEAVQVRGGLQAHPGGQGHGSVGQHLQGNSSSLSVRVVVENLVAVILMVFFRMPLLTEQVEWILKMSPRLAKHLK